LLPPSRGVTLLANMLQRRHCCRRLRSNGKDLHGAPQPRPHSRIRVHSKKQTRNRNWLLCRKILCPILSLSHARSARRSRQSDRSRLVTRYFYVSVLSPIGAICRVMIWDQARWLQSIHREEESLPVTRETKACEVSPCPFSLSLFRFFFFFSQVSLVVEMDSVPRSLSPR
jgi:hypothetical protein